MRTHLVLLGKGDKAAAQLPGELAVTAEAVGTNLISM
jgi:hypothetical protein